MQLVAYGAQELDNKHFEFYYFSERKRKYDNLKILTYDCKNSNPVVNELLNKIF